MHKKRGAACWLTGLLIAGLFSVLGQTPAAAEGLAPTAPWWDYEIIMWQAQTASALATLKQLGITAGVVEHDRRTNGYDEAELRPLIETGLGFYAENIATDFYAPYHRFTEGRPVNWRFLDVKQRQAANPSDRSVFERQPSLSDPAWLGTIRDRLAAAVRDLGGYHPLYYDLADEPGIADLSAFWDFDLSSPSLAGMRQWLQQRYGSLDALNTEWGTSFAAWGDVVPMTTQEALGRTDGNFAPWADFKAWMDVAFAAAVANGAAAIHAADPNARAGIEGGQISGWGGYDYALLAPTVDVMELYDFGHNIDLFRSFNPKAVILTTSQFSGPEDSHLVWRRLLRGARGTIIWDSQHAFASPTGEIGPRGRATEPYFRVLRGGVGALLINAARQTDPIALLYSPESFRTQWLLDRIEQGDDWHQRNASSEYAPEPTRNATDAFSQAITHAGLSYRFVSTTQLEQGALRNESYRALILPHAIALSPIAAAEIRRFVAGGGSAIADDEPGLYDDHGRKQAAPQLHDLFDGADHDRRGAIYLPDFAVADGLTPRLAAAGVAPSYVLLRHDGTPAHDIETYRYRVGTVELVALLRDAPAAGVNGAEEPVTMVLPHRAFAYDVMRGTSIGSVERVELALSPSRPALIALADGSLPPPAIDGPAGVATGNTAEFLLSAGAATDVLRVEAIDPSGAIAARYSGNALVTDGVGSWRLALTRDEPGGRWTIRVTDILSGEIVPKMLDVRP